MYNVSLQVSTRRTETGVPACDTRFPRLSWSESSTDCARSIVVWRGPEALRFSSPRFLIWEIDNDLLNWDGFIQEKELVANTWKVGIRGNLITHVAGPIIMSYI